MTDRRRGALLTVFAIGFALMAISNFSKPLSGGRGGFVLLGTRLTGVPNMIFGPLFGANTRRVRVRHLDDEKICASDRIFLRGIRDPEFDSVQRKTRERRASAAAGRACLHFDRGRIFVWRRTDPDPAQSGSRVAPKVA